jgi:hypothetical protein
MRCALAFVRGGPGPIIRFVANFGANLWGHSQDGKTTSIRAGRIHYKTRCQSKAGCSRSAVIQIECRDSIGHPFWNRDYCETHAKPVIDRAERLKIPVSWPGINGTVSALR